MHAKKIINEIEREFEKIERFPASKVIDISNNSQVNEDGKIISNEIVFYKTVYIKNKPDVVIDYVKFIELLYSFGFRRYDINKTSIFIKVGSKVISQVSILEIQDYFFDYLQGLNEILTDGVEKRFLKEKFF